MAEPLRFIGIEQEGDRYRFGAKTYTAEEMLNTPGMARRAIFTFKVTVDNTLRIVSVDESNCPSEFLKPGDQFKVDNSGEMIKLWLNDRALSLVQEFSLDLRASQPHTVRIVIINLDNRVHHVYEG